MLAVLPEQSMSHEEPSMEIEPTGNSLEVSQPPLKETRVKSKVFTRINIIILITAVALVGLGTYYLLNINSEVDVKSSISQSHDKIISHADSSKKDGSNSGSSSSKSSNSNSKPNPKSPPASKGVISSNPGLTGKSGDEPDPNDEEDDGDKRDRKLKRASSTSGGSTEEDSEQDEDDEQDENVDEGVYWVDTKLQGNNASPLVGEARP